MSDNKTFIGMVSMVNNISEGYESNKCFYEYVNMLESVDSVEDSIEESDEMSKELEDKREEYVLELKNKKDYFQKRYGEDWESVMYGTATNLAKKDLGID